MVESVRSIRIGVTVCRCCYRKGSAKKQPCVPRMHLVFIKEKKPTTMSEIEQDSDSATSERDGRTIIRIVPGFFRCRYASYSW